MKTNRSIRSIIKSILSLLICVLIRPLPIVAQSNYLEQLGPPPNGGTSPVEMGFINLNNGNLHLEVPLGTFPQRGQMPFTAKLVYDSRIWVPIMTGPSFNQLSFRPFNLLGTHPQAGWRLEVTNDPNFNQVNYGVDFEQCDSAFFPNNPSYSVYSGFSWTEPNGTVHSWDGSIATQQPFGSPNCNPTDVPNAGGYAADGSGLFLEVKNYTDITIYGTDGSRLASYSAMNDGAIPPYGEDANGNYFSLDSNGNVVDTIGRTPVITTTSGNNIFFDVLNAQGGRSRYTVTTETIPVSLPLYSSTLTVFQSVALPNGTSYQFGYDSGTTGDNWGLVNSVTLPTGGQVTYGYTTFADSTGSEGDTNRWVTSRTSGGAPWHYTPQVINNEAGGCPGGLTLGRQQVTVLKPDNSSMVYKTMLVAGSPVNYETDYYSQSGGLLKQELATYAGPDCSVQPYPPGLPPTMGNGVVIPLSSVTTTYGSGGALTTQKTYEYTNSPSVSQPTKVSEWDYFQGSAPGTPSRIITGVYTFTNPTEAAAHVIGKPLTVTLTDGAGNQIAQTSYTYDNYTNNSLVSTSGCQATSASQPSPAAPQHDYLTYCATNVVRGNLTQVSQWLNSTGTSITTATNTFDDTGNVIKTADALGHLTQVTFSPTFGLAYTTQVQNALSQITTRNYDFNTGLLLSEKDPNGQVTGLSTNYGYDNMGRATSTTFPDGGQVTVDFHGDAIPLTVTSTQTATPNPAIATTTTYDGYGRAVKKCVTDPEGDDCVDTVYDTNGQVSSVSNPHRSVASPSDGVTTFSYDGLGRQISVIEPDQNVVNNSYDIQTSPVMGQVVLATDETLRQRRTVTDGFGRLVEADEPGDSSSGTQASGTIDIGQIKTAQVGGTQLSSASAQVTISGTDSCQTIITRCTAQQLKFGCEPSSTTTCDTGKVYISVNGREYDYFFGNGGSAPDSTASVAQNLVNVIQGDSSRVVNASISPSGTNIVVLTAATAGSTGNSVSFVSGSSNDFSTSPAIGQLAGGQDAAGASTVTDQGTVTMTAGAFTTPSIAYGPGTANITAAMAATALANALSTPGSGVSAFTNGGTLITIMETSVGVSGNGVSVGVHPTSTDPTDFPSPSFTVAPTSLTGGVDPYPSGVAHPYVSRYFYDLLDNLTCIEQHGNTTGSGCSPAVMAITDNQPPAADASSPWRIRRFAFDSLGRLRWANDPESGLTSFQYNSDSVLVSATDARGVTSNFSPADSPLDALHRMTKKTFSDGSTAVTYAYDVASFGSIQSSNQIGRLVHISNNVNASTTFAYDPMGRTVLAATCIPSNCNETANQVKATYDLAGNSNTVIYPSGRKVVYSYNAAGYFTKVNFDSFNGVNVNFPYYSIPPGTGPSNWGYWPTGEMHTGVFGNGVMQTLGVNARQQVNAITQATAAQTLLSKSYGLYDASSHNNGNILSIVDVLNAGRNQTYSYDPLNRIGTGSQADGTFNLTFNYDPWGNMQESGTANFQPIFDVRNRIATSPYDAAGNLLNDGSHVYTYDAEGRMKTVDGSGVTYTYGADGDRVRKDVGTAATEFIYFGDSVIAEKNVATGTWTDYILAYGARIAKDNSVNASGAQYFHSDQVDSTRLVTDSTGTVTWQATYNPFGQELSTQNPAIRFQFAGMEYDSEDNLNHTEFRQYESAQGRWTSPDPYSGSVDSNNPQSFNRYVYVLDNPLVMRDPKGLMGCDSNATECEDDLKLDLSALASLAMLVKIHAETPTPDPEGFGPPGSHPGQRKCLLNGLNLGCDMFEGMFGPKVETLGKELAGAVGSCPLVPLEQSPKVKFTVSDKNVNLMLDPNLSYLAGNAISAANGQGVTPMITSGFRTSAAQLRARATTNFVAARLSHHQEGTAIDFNHNDPNFGTIRDAMAAQGLTWGGNFAGLSYDPVHFQIARAGTPASKTTVDALAKGCPK